MGRTLLCLLAVCPLLVAAARADERISTDPMHNWGQWRGPLSTGVAPHGDPPVEWSERDKKNIRWKTPLPGGGHSTPVVWGERIFVTAAVPVEPLDKPFHDNAPGSHDNVDVTHRYEFVVLAIGRSDGKILWQRTMQKAVPHEGGHYSGSLANHSPITDGERVYALFGSRGLYCLDFEGELKWKVDLGRMDTLHAHGEGASPVLYGETLVVNWDHEGKSFVVALHKRTGEQRWKVDRDEITSWATPIVVEHEGRPQLVISGTNRVRGYDLATGKVIWECGGLSANVVASPVARDGMVFAGSSYDKRALLAIKLAGAKGDITGTQHVAWSRSRGTPYVPSPLLYDDALYFLTHYQGILTRVNAKSGDDRPGAIRLEGMREIYASPVGAGGRVHVTDRDGATVVLTHGDIPRIIAVNQVDDTISASAAIAGRELFLRGEKFLYCIAE
jgi:outer membrane protein assembly factor BamB